MSRRKDQGGRREHLITAAERSIVHHGLARTKIRTIANEAGISPGLINYYFTELDDLYRAVYQEAIERFWTQRRRLIDGIAEPRDRLAAMVRSGLPLGPDDATCRLLYEFHPQIARNPVVKSLRTTLYDRQVALYESLLLAGASVGVFTLASPAASIAHNLVALEDAYGLHIVTGFSVTREQAERYLLDYAGAATGTPPTQAPTAS